MIHMVNYYTGKMPQQELQIVVPDRKGEYNNIAKRPFAIVYATQWFIFAKADNYRLYNMVKTEWAEV